MLYLIYAEDAENTLNERLAARPAHLARLQQLKDEGRLVIAGPHPAIDNEDLGDAGFTGSTIIAEFASQADAEAWAKQDPYVDAGVFKNVIIKPFRRTM